MKIHLENFVCLSGLPSYGFTGYIVFLLASIFERKTYHHHHHCDHHPVQPNSTTRKGKKNLIEQKRVRIRRQTVMTYIFSFFSSSSFCFNLLFYCLVNVSYSLFYTYCLIRCLFFYCVYFFD